MKFEDLEAWQEARRLVKEIYLLTQVGPLAKDYRLSSQIQAASVSIMSNIAEGFERTGSAEKLHFYNIARASCGEVRSQLYVIEDVCASLSQKATTLRDSASTVGRLISGLIASTHRRTAAGKIEVGR